MLADDRQTFDIGPRMINPIFGIFLAIACVGLAAGQIWMVVGHLAGTRSLAAQEPTARAIFAAVFIMAAFGIIVAVLEHRNGRVHLDEDGLTVCCWIGCRTRVEWEAVASVGYLRVDEEKADIPFHWLYLTTREGRSIRLAGGPWPEPRALVLLRHELTDRLGLEERETEETRWALLFPAKRTKWA